MNQFPTIWVDNSPETLLEISLKFCLQNEHVFTQYDSDSGEFCLQDNLSFPVGICERMINICKTEMADECFKKFIHFFRDTAQTHLQCLDLSDSSVDDAGLEILTKHNIISLNISNCKNLTSSCLNCIDRLSNSLVALNIGSCDQLVSGQPSKVEDNNLDHCMGMVALRSAEVDKDGHLMNMSPDTHSFPALRKLVIHNLEVAALQNLEIVPNKRTPPKYGLLLSSILRNSLNLTYIDFSGCFLRLEDVEALTFHKKLRSLILHNVETINNYIPVICKMKGLRHLDISTTVLTLFSNPNKTLKNIVDSLENLVSLDISGTNLAGSRTRERESSKDSDIERYTENLTDIPGLASRVNRPLEFLGLLNTADDACYRHHIPAKRVSGDATEEQILIAGQMYCARKEMIQKILNDLFQMFRFSSCRNTKLALDVVMEAMRMHAKLKYIQVSGSASLFYIVKGEDKKLFNLQMRRKIIKVLIDAMCSHYSDITMLRNACLTLIHFKIPDDVFFDYKRLVSLLLLIVAQENQDDFVQRIALYLLNSLACQVDGFNKKLVGDQGAISIILQLIEKRLMSDLCDEVMETAWSTLWNVTDETPANCTRFLEGKGMDLFLGCLEAFPDKPELLRNMMGLLGNVAEVKELRPHLLKDEYLSVFSELLSSKSDGIEVSYNAAGILSHIASDGEELWAEYNISSVNRKYMLLRMVNAIESWDLNTNRNINYRSFEPILRLLTIDHTPEVQLWAVWALANLTKVYPEKYCSLVNKEGGIVMLKKLTFNENFPQLSELASLVIKQCEMFYQINGNNCYVDSEDVIDNITDVS